MTLDVKITKSDENESKYIRKKLIEYNNEHVADDLKSIYEEVNLTVKDEAGKVIAGLLSVVCWNWLEVDILWVDKDCRGMGLGAKLLSEVEDIAKQKGCTFIQLNTFSFQAPDFYVKQGFKEIAVIDGSPRGFKHYYFKKDLV